MSEKQTCGEVICKGVTICTICGALADKVAFVPGTRYVEPYSFFYRCQGNGTHAANIHGDFKGLIPIEHEPGRIDQWPKPALPNA